MSSSIRAASDAVMSSSIKDFLTPGAVVVVDPDEAERLGIFEETALTAAEAWQSNMDLGGDHG